MLVEGLLGFMLALDFWEHYALAFWEHYAVAELSTKIEVLHRGFPSYMDLISFSGGLGGENVLAWKGNIISDPPP